MYCSRNAIESQPWFYAMVEATLFQIQLCIVLAYNSRSCHSANSVNILCPPLLFLSGIQTSQSPKTPSSSTPSPIVLKKWHGHATTRRTNSTYTLAWNPGSKSTTVPTRYCFITVVIAILEWNTHPSHDLFLNRTCVGRCYMFFLIFSPLLRSTCGWSWFLTCTASTRSLSLYPPPQRLAL